ncbi:hypothetical protein [Methyloterricola oryzae]|uniref:hypothetical protein n=1 Tax=Methyloterricola oryzae TaxID=1495050 RepID=UPI0005EB3ECD|nr:hypothetical protein [Methyloterricola oryzae]
MRAIALVIVFASANCQSATSYTYQVLDLWDGQTNLTSINNSGQITGYLNRGLKSHGIVYFNASYERFDVPSFTFPGTSSTVANGINDQRYIVGQFSDGRGDHAIVRDPVSQDFTPIDLPAGGSLPTFTRAGDINNLGVIVGSFTDAGQVQRGFSRDAGTVDVVSFPGPNVIGTELHDINDQGTSVGRFFDGVSHTAHGFILSNGQFDQFDVPIAGTCSTGLFGINNLGQMVGDYAIAKGYGGLGGFVYDNGTLTTISVPGFEFTTPFGINDQGVIGGRVELRWGIAWS